MLEFRYLKRFIDEATGNKHWETVLQVKHHYEPSYSTYGKCSLCKAEKPEWKDVPIVEEEINKQGDYV